jgi:hypothetical protein
MGIEWGIDAAFLRAEPFLQGYFGHPVITPNLFHGQRIVFPVD